jgi:hypothetical protein
VSRKTLRTRCIGSDRTYDRLVVVYGTGMCPVDGDSLTCLVSRKTETLVLFCPLCGVGFREAPRPFDTDGMALRIDELAPAGVVPATRGEIEAAGITEVVELNDTVVSWVDEVLWQPPRAGQTDEEATKVLFDRWYHRPGAYDPDTSDHGVRREG